MFWQVFNFLVLMWLLKRYLYTPVTEVLKERTRTIENEIQEAEQKNSEAEKLKEKYQQELKENRLQAQSILEEAESRAKNKARETIKESKREAEMIKEKKMQEIEEAKKEALLDLRNEVATISLLIAGKIIQESIDQKKHEQLINQYISELDREITGEF